MPHKLGRGSESCHYNLSNLLPDSASKVQGSCDLEEAYPVQAWQQVRLLQGNNYGMRKVAWRQDRFWPPFPANGV